MFAFNKTPAGRCRRLQCCDNDNFSLRLLHASFSSSSWVKNEFLTFHFPSNIRAKTTFIFPFLVRHERRRQCHCWQHQHWWCSPSSRWCLAGLNIVDKFFSALRLGTTATTSSLSCLCSFLLSTKRAGDARKWRKNEYENHKAVRNLIMWELWNFHKNLPKQTREHKWKAKPENLFLDGLCGDFSLQNFFSCYLMLICIYENDVQRTRRSHSRILPMMAWLSGVDRL